MATRTHLTALAATGLLAPNVTTLSANRGSFSKVLPGSKIPLKLKIKSKTLLDQTPIYRASTSRRARLTVAASKVDWPVAYEYLKDTKLRSVSAEEAKGLMGKGWVLLDVRPDDVFDKSRAADSKNAALFQPIRGFSPLQILKGGLLMSMGVAPVEENLNFVEDARVAISGSKGVIVTCAEGGSMEASPNFPNAKSSRSLVAAYKCDRIECIHMQVTIMLHEISLIMFNSFGHDNKFFGMNDAMWENLCRILEAGVCQSTQVVHLSSGLNGWFRAQLPAEGPEEWEFNARTPTNAVDSTSRKKKQ